MRHSVLYVVERNYYKAVSLDTYVTHLIALARGGILEQKVGRNVCEFQPFQFRRETGLRLNWHSSLAREVLIERSKRGQNLSPINSSSSHHDYYT